MAEVTASTSAVRPRLALLVAGALTSGPRDVAEFLLPLWAGVQLGASAGVSGGLLTLELAGSVIGRLVAGGLVDRGRRRSLAVTATLLLTLGLVGFAAAPGVAVAAVAAVLVGLGGAGFMVTVLAHLADLGGGTQRYGALFSWETFGGLVAFVLVLGLFDLLSLPVVFAGLAVATALAAVLVARAGLPEAVAPGAVLHEPVRDDVPGLAPVIALTALTAFAQGTLLLLAMFRLQRGLGMEIQDVGLVLGPGYLLFVAAGASSHRVAETLGAARALYVSLGAAVVMAALLSLGDSAPGVAVAWCAAAIGLGLAQPVERAAVARRSGGRHGHAFGLHGVAGLGGGAVGAAAAGWMFGALPWPAACLAVAVVTAAALTLVAPSTRS